LVAILSKNTEAFGSPVIKSEGIEECRCYLVVEQLGDMRNWSRWSSRSVTASGSYSVSWMYKVKERPTEWLEKCGKESTYERGEKRSII
jgi:hypothetical protein